MKWSTLTTSLVVTHLQFVLFLSRINTNQNWVLLFTDENSILSERIASLDLKVWHLYQRSAAQCNNLRTKTERQFFLAVLIEHSLIYQSSHYALTLWAHEFLFLSLPCLRPGNIVQLLQQNEVESNTYILWLSSLDGHK